MKKFVKGSLITAGILAALGCIFCLISGLAGGRRSLVYFVENDEYIEDKLEKVGDTLSDIHIGNWRLVWRDHEFAVSDDRDETVAREVAEDTVPIEGIKNLELELGAGEFIIRKKEASDGVINIYVEGVGKCDNYVKNGTLHVEGFKGLQVIGNAGSENKITLEIPADMVLDEIDVEIGAGIMEISDFNVKEFDAEIGAGELTLENIEAKEFSAEIGAGRLSAENVSAQNAEVTVSMGECIYNGTISKNLEAECDMGNMKFQLSGKEEEHNYEIECAAGNIEVGSLSFTALAAEKRINNGVKSTYEISCSMGDITVRFEE